jgi:hypothetical protein
MATIDSIEVAYERKVQLDQFEPVAFGATASVTIEDDEDPAEVYSVVSTRLQDAVERELARRVANKKADDR